MVRQEIISPSEFSSREFFHQKLSQAIEGFVELEQIWGKGEYNEQKLLMLHNFHQQFFSETALENNYLGNAEKALFFNLFDLFSFKHKITDQDKTLSEVQKNPRQGRTIGFLGPLSVGKTTAALEIAKDFGVELATTEPFENNPFWQAQQKKSDKYDEFMLRSQIFFLLSNLSSDIRSDVRSRINSTTLISDTSILTDILMWVEWYHRTNKFSDEEYQAYMRLVNLFMPIVPKPDLLVVLNADSAANLKTGVDKRRENDDRRKGETFTEEELKIQMEITDQLTEDLREQNVPILKMIVNPPDIQDNPYIGYEVIYQIRNKLGLLGEFLKPKPEVIVEKIRSLLAETRGGQVIVVHAKSMFTGKTTVLCQLADKVGVEKIKAFQPKNALRQSGQEEAVISRDGSQIKATLIEDSDLWTMVEKIKAENINSQKTPYIFIDEIQLFTNTEKEGRTAVAALEELRNLGFHVIIDGIDYSFQGEPFTFMFKLLKEVNQKDSWHAFEMSTRCRYCKKPAEGTRRIKQGQIADYHDKVFLAGDLEMYEPVCCEAHVSCVNQPEGFKKSPLPTEIKL